MNSNRIENRITDLIKLTGVSDAHAIEELTDHYLSRIEEEVRLGVNSQKAVRETYQEIANLDTSHFTEEKNRQDKRGLLLFLLIFIGIAFYLFQYNPEPNQSETTQEQTAEISAINPPIGSPILQSKLQISSEFGLRLNPLAQERELHKGIDIRARIGTPVLSTGNGTVKEAGFKPQAGNYIIIQHDGNYLTKYYHLSYISVRSNETVNEGHVIGKVGNSGLSLMPHLHYEVLKNDVPVNPRGIIEP